MLVVRFEGADNRQVVALADGIFFEDMIVSSAYGIFESSKVDLFTSTGVKMGVLDYSTKLTSIGNPPKFLQRQIMRNRQIMRKSLTMGSSPGSPVTNDRT